MNEMALRQSPNDYVSGFAETMKMAERELAAFFNAVKELFGAKQAEISVSDWLAELETADPLPVAIREWRLITIKAATRLASRLHPTFQYD